jgi:hypothetical protein
VKYALQRLQDIKHSEHLYSGWVYHSVHLYSGWGYGSGEGSMSGSPVVVAVVVVLGAYMRFDEFEA